MEEPTEDLLLTLYTRLDIKLPGPKTGLWNWILALDITSVLAAIQKQKSKNEKT